jgi:hypothetical protein
MALPNFNARFNARVSIFGASSRRWNQDIGVRNNVISLKKRFLCFVSLQAVHEVVLSGVVLLWE